MNRRFVLILLTILFSLTTFFVFAQSEPMANEECTAEILAERRGQIDELYTEAQTAFEAGDMRGWLDNLRAISWLTNMTRAFCDGFSFEGDAEGSNSTVIGPVIFPVGIYTVTATTPGYMTVRIEEIAGGCGIIPLSMIISEGNAANGAQEVMRVEDEPCNALLQISNLTEAWTLQFSFIASGD